ncbi:MAG: hypothetical protein JSW42_02775, partial [Chloroflexota bacterium]
LHYLVGLGRHKISQDFFKYQEEGLLVGKDSKPQLSEAEQRFHLDLNLETSRWKAASDSSSNGYPLSRDASFVMRHFEGFGGSLLKRALNKYPSKYKSQVRNTCFDVVRKEQIGA